MEDATEEQEEGEKDDISGCAMTSALFFAARSFCSRSLCFRFRFLAAILFCSSRVMYGRPAANAASCSAASTARRSSLRACTFRARCCRCSRCRYRSRAPCAALAASRALVAARSLGPAAATNARRSSRAFFGFDGEDAGRRAGCFGALEIGRPIRLWLTISCSAVAAATITRRTYGMPTQYAWFCTCWGMRILTFLAIAARTRPWSAIPSRNSSYSSMDHHRRVLLLVILAGLPEVLSKPSASSTSNGSSMPHRDDILLPDERISSGIPKNKKGGGRFSSRKMPSSTLEMPS